MSSVVNSQRRWGQGDRTSQDQARERLIAAARRCYQSQGIQRTTMANIADEANVVRATLYRYFKTKEAILRAVFYVEVEDFLQAFKASVTTYTGFCDYLTQFLLFSLQQAPDTPIHQQFFSEDSALWVSREYLADDSALGLTVALLEEPFRIAQGTGEIQADIELLQLVEWLARILISFILVPGEQRRSEDELRALFEVMLIRSIRV